MSWGGVKEVYDNLNPKKWYKFLMDKYEYDIEKTGPYHMVYYIAPITNEDINTHSILGNTLYPHQIKASLMNFSDEDGCLLCIGNLLKEYGDNIKFI